MEINTGNQLKGYIQREIKEHPMHSNYGYNYYFSRSFLQKLYEENANFFVLRGSYSQYANTGQLFRPLTDIDLITFNFIGESSDRLESTIEDDNSPIRFKIKNKFVTTNSTINYRILGHFDQIQQLISIDLKRQDKYKTVDTEMPKLFSQDKPFDVNATSLEKALSSKLYIVLLNFYLQKSLGKKYRRFKDFYDIYTLLDTQDINMRQVRKYLNEYICKDEFLKDFTIADDLFDDNFREANLDSWNQEKKEYEFNPYISFDDSLEVARDTINRLK